MSSLRVSCPKIVEDEAVNELCQFYPEIEDLYVNSCSFNQREELVTVCQTVRPVDQRFHKVFLMRPK